MTISAFTHIQLLILYSKRLRNKKLYLYHKAAQRLLLITSYQYYNLSCSFLTLTWRYVSHWRNAQCSTNTHPICIKSIFFVTSSLDTCLYLCICMSDDVCNAHQQIAAKICLQGMLFVHLAQFALLHWMKQTHFILLSRI